MSQSPSHLCVARVVVSPSTCTVPFASLLFRPPFPCRVGGDWETSRPRVWSVCSLLSLITWGTLVLGRQLEFVSEWLEG